MIFSSLFRTRTNKRFNYTPRYYDERQEALKELVERVQAEKDGKIPTRHELKFHKKYGSEKLKRSSNLRVLLIIAVLVCIVIYIFI